MRDPLGRASPPQIRQIWRFDADVLVAPDLAVGAEVLGAHDLAFGVDVLVAHDLAVGADVLGRVMGLDLVQEQ